MSCIKECNSAKISLLINDFFVSAGGVLIDEAQQRVLIVKKIASGEYLLPKGTKEDNESIEETAVREVYEETGYLNELTNPGKLLAIQIRPQVNGTKGQHKIIYWFYNRLVCDHKHEGTQEDYEDFLSQWHSFDEAMRVLTYEEDKRLVRSAFGNSAITTRSNQSDGTAELKSALESAQSTGSIRIMILVDELIRSFAYVTFDKPKENVLIYIDCNDCCTLPINIDKYKQQKLPNQKPFAFQVIEQDSENDCKILEWYIIFMDIQNSGLSDQQLKWYSVSEALNLLKNVDELTILKLAIKSV